MLKKITHFFLFCLFVFMPVPGGAMYLFEPKCAFSKVEGVVLEGGVPVEGAEVEQSYYWGDKPTVNTVKTDKQGRFHFSVANRYSLLVFFPHNPYISQEITIRYQGKSYEAYLSSKGDYDENTELNGQPLNFICDLKNEPSRDDGFYGICTLK